MRYIGAGLGAAILALILAAPAAASCALPAPVAENAARAVAVVYGTVIGTEPGAFTIRVDKVLKGEAASPLRLFVGPGRSSGSGQVVFTSVDYRAAPVGSDHVLYVVRGADGQLETNACIGSHAGRPDGIEAAFFGAGTAPGTAQPQGTLPAGAATAPPEAPGDAPVVALDPVPVLLILMGVGATAVAMFVLLARRISIAER